MTKKAKDKIKKGVSSCIGKKIKDKMIEKTIMKALDDLFERDIQHIIENYNIGENGEILGRKGEL